MTIKKAVITAARKDQRALPLQTLVDRSGQPTSVLGIILDEAVRAGIEEICVILHSGDEKAYREAAGSLSADLQFVPQTGPPGYSSALYCARKFTGGEPFLHMVGDHLYVSTLQRGCAEQLLQVAQDHNCSVSGVQPTRENLLPYFGVVGGRRVSGTQDLYLVESIVEKPTPTQAEQQLQVPGLRAGHYLCFFGMHIFSPLMMEVLHHLIQRGQASPHLSPVLTEVARQERYLALQVDGRRYALDAEYGLLTAQLALALNGRDREKVLATVCELLAQHHLDGKAGERL